MEESEVCSLPGGVASVRHQFESQGTASSSSSHNVAQVHFQHRTVQEVSHLEGMAMGGARQVLPGNRQPDYHQEAVITHSANNMESSYNHNNETEEDFPKFTTKELRDHFERTIEEAGPSKQMKIRVLKSELCTVCRRRVYPMDAVIMDRKKYHKTCFCCQHCSSPLTLGNSISHHGHLYCLAHYKQLLKSKGNLDRLAAPAVPYPPQADWRHSVSSLDSAQLLDDIKPNASKMSVVWPPQAGPTIKGFKMEEDIQLTRPQWPPPDHAPKSLPQQHRKAVPRSVI